MRSQATSNDMNKSEETVPRKRRNNDTVNSKNFRCAMGNANKKTPNMTRVLHNSRSSFSTLKVLTYNVWFDQFHYTTRMASIIDRTLKLQPDVCCYQEVLPQFFSMLMAHEDLNRLYDISPFSPNRYGNVTLARKDLNPQFMTTEFPTRMGRKLLKTVCTVNGFNVAIGNVHLESLASEKFRKEQLIICEKSLRKYPCAVLVGDFNFCSEQNFHNDSSYPLENDVLQAVMPSYVDTWQELRQGSSGNNDVGYTFDSDVNTMIKSVERMRYDRIIYRSSNGRLCPEEIEIQGNDPILDHVWSSDHFGVLATFRLETGGDEPLGEISRSNEDESLRQECRGHINGAFTSREDAFSVRQFESEVDLKIDKILRAAIMQEEYPLRILAIDFDATICQVHTYGRWRGSASTLAAHIRPIFVSIIKSALDQDPSLLRVGIVTFSGQKDLIRQVLEALFGQEMASRIHLRTALRDWVVPDSYVPQNRKLEGKQPYISSIMQEYHDETKIQLRPEQVMLIDDDANNIRIASDHGYKTVLFPSLPLPGIKPSVQVAEASGVDVIHRVQVAHGTLLCVSRGSVVQFCAPNSGAIVNAANCAGLQGGGVDGAIGRAGGESLFLARKALPVDSNGYRIPTGECRATGPDAFGALQVPYVLHTVGPDYNTLDMPSSRGDSLLASAYVNSIACAKRHGIEYLGFSLLSSGVYRGDRPLRKVLEIALDSIARSVYEGLREVHLIAFTQEEENLLSSILKENPPLAIVEGAGNKASILQFVTDFERACLYKSQ